MADVKITKITLDPTDSFPERSEDDLIQSLGLLPQMIHTWPESLTWKQWIDVCYAHGGGWDPFGPWRLDKDGTLTYLDASDPPYKPIAKYTLDAHIIYQYDHGWVCHLNQVQDNHEVARMD